VDKSDITELREEGIRFLHKCSLGEHEFDKESQGSGYKLRGGKIQNPFSNGRM
jgi:hypothetical protein